LLPGTKALRLEASAVARDAARHCTLDQPKQITTPRTDLKCDVGRVAVHLGAGSPSAPNLFESRIDVAKRPPLAAEVASQLA
jgi:hypothetical protein